MNVQDKAEPVDGGASAPASDEGSITVRFAGDSGDGIQLIGAQFAQATALSGNSLATFPDFPAEIRAPAGTTYGVSAFQIKFGSRRIRTSGDQPDVLVALNPAALKVNLDELPTGGLIVIDGGSFQDRNLAKAGFDQDPRSDGTLKSYRVIEIDISEQALEVAKPFGLTQKEALRCKNMWVLGLVDWMYGRGLGATEDFLTKKFGEASPIAQANIAALKAGHAYGETVELSGDVAVQNVPAVAFDPGTYRLITGAEALSWGLIAGCQRAGLDMTFCSYPITPSSPILHILARQKHFGVTTFQAEDEIAAACAAIGASYAGNMGITASSGPGIALKTEALGLAIGCELPLVVVNTQRAGPSTGMPTKTEQSDLYISVWGRNGDAPMPVLAARSASDCFEVAMEAVRIATTFMTPVTLLSDGYIANAAEPWKIPDVDTLEPFPVEFRTDPNGYQPFDRNPKTLARDWVKPGTPDLMHRIGGIERDQHSGHISYDPTNHQVMTDFRHNKVDGVNSAVPEQAVDQGPQSGRLAVVGWGSTYGPIGRAVTRSLERGMDVAHIHLRHIWPLPRNLDALLDQYETVIVPEMNVGQLATLLRSYVNHEIISLPKVTGQPFTITEIEDAIHGVFKD